jgi:hypothetical protein
MISKNHVSCMARVAAVLTASLAFLNSCAAQAATTSEPAAVAHRVWDALLTHCGESYFYAGSVFDSSGMLNDVQVGHQTTIEYRGVRFNQVPIRVTDAERANGVQYDARISLLAHLYREGDGTWQDGPDRQPRNTDDIIGRALADVNSDLFDMGGGGAIALRIVKYKGQWAVTRSSTTSTSTLALGEKFYDVDKLVAAKVARYDCKAGAVVEPPLSRQELHDRLVGQAMSAGASREGAEQRAAAADRAHIFRNATKGVPFAAISDDDIDNLDGIDRYLSETGDEASEHLKAEEDRNFWTEVERRMPDEPNDNQWLAPGTHFTAECYDEKGGCDLYRGAPKYGDRRLVILWVTSGPHTGQLAMIDEVNFKLSETVNRDGVAGYGSIR